MPELPEVETTRRGIAPEVDGRKIARVVVRESRMRWPVPEDLAVCAEGQAIVDIRRRGKYLLLDLETGSIIIHLGMSGNLRVLDQGTPAKKHEHIDIELDSGKLLRLTDPRRFGAVLWQPAGSLHKLLSKLGPEPLLDLFDSEYLVKRSKGRALAIKQLIMNAEVVVGVGNIYANEALFRAGIDPRRSAGRISKSRLARLVIEIKRVLTNAINRGGTTLRDFLSSEGKPGYFAQELLVYGRAGEPCKTCSTILKEVRMSQRSTVFCPKCQR